MLNFLDDYINSKPLKMITYHEYIDIALYHPQYGYYMKEKEKIGRNGDFVTSSNIANVMGSVIAKWYSEMVEKYSLSPSVCEVGAGTGRFAKAFFEGWRSSSQEELTYIIIEKSPYHRDLQKKQLDCKMNIQYMESIKELTNFNGLIFSNELFDALPVHVIEKRDDQLYEMMISYSNGQLTEEKVILSNPHIYRFLDQYHISLVDGQRIEIPLSMEKMVFQMSEGIDKGLIMTIDYGYTNEEWSHPIRRDGSLRGYHQHQMINNVLLYPGDMDITSHIHWEALETLGKKYGLHKIGRWSQHEYLVKIGLLNELVDHQDAHPFSEANKHNRAVRSLMMPQGISDAFHILLQGKGIEISSTHPFNFI